jgi:hypothetical protein
MKNFIILLCFIALPLQGAIKSTQRQEKHWGHLQKQILKSFSNPKLKKIQLLKLKSRVLDMKKLSVPVLVEVMKNGKYPEKNRWIATMLLGRLMGKKAAPFISKFSKHPSWVLRMASLKVLLALSQKQYAPLFAKMLQDHSLLVRSQALENIKRLHLSDYAPYVWRMLYDPQNYVHDKNSKHRRTSIIKNIITTVGLLNFKKAEKPLLKMAVDRKYKDIFIEVDQALSLILGKSSPKGSAEIKRHFWKRLALSKQTI